MYNTGPNIFRSVPQWQLNQWVVVLANFLAYLGMTFVMPFLPLYVKGLDVADPAEAAFWAGLIMAATPLVSVASSPMWGAAADRFGRKTAFEVCLAVFFLNWIAMLWVTNVYQLLFLRILLGVASGYTALVASLIAIGAEREQLSRGMGLVQGGQFIAFTIGPAFGGFFADRFGIQRSFYFPAALFLCSLVATHFLYRDMLVKDRQEPTIGDRAGVFELVKLPAFLPIMAILLAAQFVDKGLTFAIPLFVATLPDAAGNAASVTGVIISIGGATAAVSSLVFGRMAAKHSPWRLLAFTLVAGLVVSVPMIFVTTSWQLMILRALLGILAGGTLTLAFIVGGLALPGRNRGRAMGLLSSGFSLGHGLSPLINGIVLGVNIRGGFAMATIAYCLGVLALRPATNQLRRARQTLTAGASR